MEMDTVGGEDGERLVGVVAAEHHEGHGEERERRPRGGALRATSTRDRGEKHDEGSERARVHAGDGTGKVGRPSVSLVADRVARTPS